MKFRTIWLAGLLAPMLVAFSAHAIPTELACGRVHSLVIDKGNLFAMGSNANGATFLGTSATDSYTPVFTGVSNVRSAAVTMYRAAYLKSDGTAMLAGLSYSQYRAMAPTAFPAGNIDDIALSMQTVWYLAGGQVYSWSGEPGSVPVAVPGASGVAQIAAGTYHLVMLFSDGTVATYSLDNVSGNARGQRGDGTTASSEAAITRLSFPTRVVEIAAGDMNTFVRTQEANPVYGFGTNTAGELGQGDTVNRLVPTKIASLANVKKMAPGVSRSLFLLGDASVTAVGWHNYIYGGMYNTNLNMVSMPFPAVADICSGQADKAILRMVGDTNTIQGWGGNLNGSLGDGTNTERHQLSAAYYTPPPPPVVVPPPVVAPPPVVTPPPVVNPPPVVTPPAPTTYTNMNECLKANPKVANPGKYCESRIAPKDRGVGNDKKSDDPSCKNLTNSLHSLFAKVNDDDAYRCGTKVYAKKSDCKAKHKDDKHINVDEYCKAISEHDDDGERKHGK